MPLSDTPGTVNHLRTAKRRLDHVAEFVTDSGKPPSEDFMRSEMGIRLANVQAHALIAVAERLDRVIELLETVTSGSTGGR